MLSNDDGLVAALYSPCEVRTMVRNTEVRILEETEYPFQGSVRIKIEPAAALSFPLRLRIPAWASVPVILVNGTPGDASHDSGFAKIERTWKAGDVVELRFPCPRESLKATTIPAPSKVGPSFSHFRLEKPG